MGSPGEELFWQLIIPTAITFLVLVASVLLAPVGAVICVGVARRRGLDTVRYGLAGTVYTLMLLLPLAYLLPRMNGDRPAVPAVVIGYLLLYAVWIVGSLGMMALYAGVLPDSIDDRSFRSGSGLLFFLNLGSLALSLIGPVSWVFQQSPQRGEYDPFGNIGLLMPFVLAFLWVAFMPIAFFMYL